MSGVDGCDRVEYLNRARMLRDTAAQVNNQRVIDALISFAETYERMATWLEQDRRESNILLPNIKRARSVTEC